MKLLSLNIEGKRHLRSVRQLLDDVEADTVCLQEAPEEFQVELQKRGYATAFLPMAQFPQEEDEFIIGVLCATRELKDHTLQYYYRPSNELLRFDMQDKRNTMAQGYLRIATECAGKTYHVISSHFTWTPNGAEPNEDQREDIDTMLTMLANEPPHVLVGDMNIPRSKSPLYARFLEHYADAIPSHYASSLDRQLHRLANDPKKSLLFTDFMVDYVFTQPPYRATNVGLRFGVSDHAAVIADVQKD